MLLLVLLCAGAVIAAVFFARAKDGAQAVVYVSGNRQIAFPLGTDREYTIHGAGGGTNTLVIEGGQAYIREASCPDGICMQMGKIHLSGQSVICLPNQVVVEIQGGSAEEALDAVSR